MDQKEIEAGLREFGLGRGDVVLLHSSLSSLGHVDGGADALVDAFLAVLTDEGTLVVPTFGALGVVTQAVKNRSNAVSSIHPVASVAAIGKRAEEICRGHWKAELAHGKDTPYTRIAELGGYVCLLGVDQDRNTTLHTAEELLRQPYLKRTAEKTFETPEGEVTKFWPYFPGPHRNFIGLDRLFRESGKMKTGRIGTSVVRLARSRDLVDLCIGAGTRNPAFALCDNPACAPCVMQRADLRRDRFAKEDFKLAASARLAGRYIPEMVENCRAAGIDAVELDVLRDRPVQALPAKELAAATEELRAADIEVCSLRLSAVTESTGKLFGIAARAVVRRVVLPLSNRSAAHLQEAEESGVTLSFYNSHQDGQTASEMLLGLTSEGRTPGFTFNAANFARAGENPFLKSYKTKLRRFIDQLDVEDCSFDGAPAPLAQGNAEIKEMVSILRCAAFPGHVVLAASNRHTGDLADAAARLERLLDAM